MRWYADGSRWDGIKSYYVIANEQRNFPIEEFRTRYTNNEMEYKAVIRALEEGTNGDEVCSDSQLLVNQIHGTYKARAKWLRPYYRKVKELQKAKGIKITWIPRQENRAGKILVSHVEMGRLIKAGGVRRKVG